jgi:uncharacterized membrane protein YidH (DUF202 family)
VTARDPGLQPERTSLAWRRTGLAAVTASLVLARIAVLRDARAIAAVCAGVAIIGLAASVEGSVRHGARRRWFEQERAGDLSPVAVGAVVSVVALAAAGLWLTVTA